MGLGRSDRRRLRLRQVPRQLPHGPEPRPRHPCSAPRRGRPPAVAHDRQHLRLGHGLQLGQRRMPARHQEWPPHHRRGPRLARPRRRPHVPSHRRGRTCRNRRRQGDLRDRERGPGAGWRGTRQAQARRPLSFRAARLRSGLPAARREQPRQPRQNGERRGSRPRHPLRPRGARPAGPRLHADLRTPRGQGDVRLRPPRLADAPPRPDGAGAGICR